MNKTDKIITEIKPKREYSAKALAQLAKAGLTGGRKKLPPEEKKRRETERRKKRYADKITFQARTDEKGKDKLEAFKKHLRLKNNDQLLNWFIERGERSLARKGEKLELD